jgi:hypothetical protein
LKTQPIIFLSLLKGQKVKNVKDAGNILQWHKVQIRMFVAVAERL